MFVDLGGSLRTLLLLLITFEDRSVAHGARHYLLFFLLGELARDQAHVMLQSLIEPHPNALLVELMFARGRHDQLLLLFQSLLADATVRLVGEL